MGSSLVVIDYRVGLFIKSLIKGTSFQIGYKRMINSHMSCRNVLFGIRVSDDRIKSMAANRMRVVVVDPLLIGCSR